MPRDTRLQKAMSLWGVCSRRQAETLIAQNRVKINGRPCKVGDKVDLNRDIVSLDGEIIGDRARSRQERRYIMLNKPRGYITTLNDELGRRTVAELVKNAGGRLFPVGRLDKNSEGLLLFTDDGEFANLLMHPKKKVTKVYRVTVRPEADEEALLKLAESIEIDGRKTQPATIRALDRAGGRSVVEIVLQEGRNRQIRHLCEHAGLEVARLKRTSYGPLKLGMLKPGTWRELKKQEVAALRGAAGLTDRGEQKKR